MAAFPNATYAKACSHNSSLISEQISIMELAVINAIMNNQFSVDINHATVTSFNSTTVIGTPMTNNNALGESYYKSWQGWDIDPVKNNQMQEVIDYFTGLGYSIQRILNTLAPSPAYEIFLWRISW